MSRGPGIAGRRICPRASAPAGWRSPPATSRCATAARSATRRMRDGRVDTELGDVGSWTMSIVEDGGMLVNPMIVDGQVIGGTAQGIGTALYEEMPFDAARPAARLDARRLPAAGRDRGADAAHRCICRRPRRYTMFGQKGIGEGGAIGPPAAIANAVNDALAPLGVESRSCRSRRSACSRHCSARMKPAAFDLCASGRIWPRPSALLARPGARVLAGGQSLGPMLNLRLAQPDCWCSCPVCTELRGVAADGGCGDDRRRRDACGDRGRRVPDIGRQRAGARRRGHRVSGGAQSRHDRRQPVPCRSGGGLGHDVDRTRCARC